MRRALKLLSGDGINRHNDVATANLIENRIDEAERWT